MLTVVMEAVMSFRFVVLLMMVKEKRGGAKEEVRLFCCAR
jgi:hypothetical protein